MWAADNPIGHHDRLGSGLSDEGLRFFRNRDIIADVCLVLGKPASKMKPFLMPVLDEIAARRRG
ncbi:MAG TPA: hypothetical protein VG308_18100 [Stellaceae bacterium]|nr:hypothetical protein [Stellaceae bacterium]